MSWAITGATGQLGRTLIDLLEEKGASFRGWSKDDLDISNKDSIREIVQSKPKILVNCAAYTNVEKAESEEVEADNVNNIGAANMAHAARELGIPFIHISTDYVFSGSKNSPWLVDDETGPISVYGVTKLKGENSVMSIYPQGSYILRTSWLYSQYGKNFAKSILKKVLQSDSDMRVVHDQFGQPTSAIDLAAQIYNLVNSKPPVGTYHASNSGQGTWFEFSREIANLCGENDLSITPITSEEFPTKAKRPTYSVLDLTQWKKVGMSAMPDWRDGLKRAFPAILSRVKEELSNG